MSGRNDWSFLESEVAYLMMRVGLGREELGFLATYSCSSSLA